jgi:hypothetical protein
VATCCLAFALAAAGQESGTDCKDLSYQNRNQTDYGPLRVATIRGSTKDAQGVAIPKVCVGVFTEGDHKLIAATQSDGNGDFALKDIPNGDYRLVAKYEGFSPANAKLRVEQRTRSKKPLAVQMRPAGLDSGSFVELK